jgi:hypothetical protein
MARPVVGAAKDKQLTVRLDAELRVRLERVRVALSKRAGGVDLVTSHVVREVLERGLDSWSASQAGSSGGLITVTDQMAIGESSTTSTSAAPRRQSRPRRCGRSSASPATAMAGACRPTGSEPRVVR